MELTEQEQKWALDMFKVLRDAPERLSEKQRKLVGDLRQIYVADVTGLPMGKPTDAVEPKSDKSYMEIIREKLTKGGKSKEIPSDMSPFELSSKTMSGDPMRAIQNISRTTLEAIGALKKKTDVPGIELEPTFKKRFETGRTPSELAKQPGAVTKEQIKEMQKYGIPYYPPAPVQGLDIMLDPFIVPGVRIAKSLLKATKVIKGMGKASVTTSNLAKVLKEDKDFVNIFKGDIAKAGDKEIVDFAVKHSKEPAKMEKVVLESFEDYEKIYEATKAEKIGQVRKPLWQMGENELQAYKQSPVAMRPVENTIEINAQKVKNMYVRNEAVIEQMHQKSVKKLYHDLKRGVVDVSGNVKKQLLKDGGELGRKAVIEKDLIAGAHSKAARDIEVATKDIYGGLSKDEITLVDQIIDSNRKKIIDSYKNEPVRKGAKNFAEGYEKEVKHTEGLTGSQHEDFLKSLPQDTQEKLFPVAQKYFKEMRNQLDQGLAEGILDKELYDKLIKYDYSKRKFLDYIDPDVTYEFGSKGTITVSSSGINKLKHGSTGYMETNSKLLLSETVSRMQTRIARNKSNKALYDFAEAKPGNGIAEIADAKVKAPGGQTRIHAMINGEPKAMNMPNGIAKEWVKSDPLISHTTANIVSWLTGSKILKTMATGINPEFAMTNFPRDIAHIWLTTTEYSSTAPGFGLQIANDLRKVTKDAITRKGRFVDYINEGGGMEFLTHQGKVAPGAKGFFKGLQNVLGYLGETSEIITRLALRNRALRNLASKGKIGIDAQREATWIARNYLDFSQGGSVAKMLDSGMPYLNAGIQGTRGVFRAAAQNPKVFTYKVGQIGTLASGLYLANNFQNPEALSQISERDKINNFIITTPFSYKDKDGNDRYIYFKIAKDQGQRAIAQVFEALTAESIGNEYDYNALSEGIKDAIPVGITDFLPPVLKSAVGYLANKDFWRMKDIWRGNEVEPHAESTKYTPPFYSKLGGVTGLSPEKTKYALEQVFTSGNIYTSLVGHGWNTLTKDMSSNERNMVTEQVMLKQPFVRRFAKTTDPNYKYDKAIKEKKILSNTVKHQQNLGFDILIDKYFNKEVNDEDLVSYIESIGNPNDAKRLLDRYKRSLRLQKVPERRFWLNLSDLDPEARAEIFWDRYKTAKKEEQDYMMKMVFKVPGIKSERFINRLTSLKGGAK